MNLPVRSARRRGHAAAPQGFTERKVQVNGVRLHYFIGGKGSAVVLLHGYAQTSHMWRPVMGELVKRTTKGHDTE